MHVETLKVFCDVARHRSFSLAAQLNQISQSAASQAVSHLERRLGTQLFDRSVRPLQLTANGKRFFEGCRELLASYMELEASLREAPETLNATLQVAAIYSVGLRDMAALLDEFRGVAPGTEVRIEYLHPDRVYEHVLQGTADLGLVSFPRRARELTAIPWRDEPMVLACSPASPFAGRKSVNIAELNGARYVHFDKGLVIRREVDRHLREGGAEVNVVLEFDNIENIKKAVEIDAGVALLPEPCLTPEVKAGTLVALKLASQDFVRPLGIIHRSHEFSPAARRFVDFLRQAEEPRSTGRRRRPAAGALSAVT